MDIFLKTDLLSPNRRKVINQKLQEGKTAGDIALDFKNEAKKAKKNNDAKGAENATQVEEWFDKVDNVITTIIPGKKKDDIRSGFLQNVLNANEADPAGKKEVSKLDINTLAKDDGYISDKDVLDRFRDAALTPSLFLDLTKPIGKDGKKADDLLEQMLGGKKP